MDLLMFKKNSILLMKGTELLGASSTHWITSHVTLKVQSPGRWFKEEQGTDGNWRSGRSRA
eukprot:11585368-Prorocentrum_lima.AAC.1